MRPLAFSGVHLRPCWSCNAPSAPLRCERCRRAAWCSYSCRRSSLKEHLSECLAPWRSKLERSDVEEALELPAVAALPRRRGPASLPARAALREASCVCLEGGRSRWPRRRRCGAALGRKAGQKAISAPVKDLAEVRQRQEEEFDLIEKEIMHVDSCDGEMGTIDILLRRLLLLEMQEKDGPGFYHICEPTALVTADVAPDSGRVAELFFGADVSVLETLYCPEDDILRARIARPPGWIMLKSLGASRRTVAERHPTPGTYYVVHEGTLVTEAEGLESKELAELAFGEKVFVSQVVHNAKETRIRGRIDSPRGWISLSDPSSGHRWAVRQPRSSRNCRETGVHEGVTCDRCLKNPLVGLRHKHKSRDDYDLCAACVASGEEEPEDYVKILPGIPLISSPADVAASWFFQGWCLFVLRKHAPSTSDFDLLSNRMKTVLDQVYNVDALSVERQALACDMLSRHFAETDDRAKATAYAERALAKQPTSARHLHLSQAILCMVDESVFIEMRQSLVAKARGSLDEAIALDDGNAQAYVVRNQLLEELGEVREARHLAKACLESSPWALELQRPCQYVPDLLARPWHFPADSYAASRHLRDFMPEALPELLAFVEDERTVWHRIPDSCLLNQAMEVKVLLGLLPGWVQVFAEEDDTSDLEALQGCEPDPADDGKAECPITTDMLLAEPSIEVAANMGIGRVVVARLAPGARLLPRCGSTNARLTCVVALTEPDDGGCLLEVGDAKPRAVTRDDGVLVFDDSFEHGFSNTSEVQSCSLLLAHFLHPDLPDDELMNLSREMSPAHVLRAQSH